MPRAACRMNRGPSSVDGGGVLRWRGMHGCRRGPWAGAERMDAGTGRRRVGYLVDRLSAGSEQETVTKT